MLVIEGEKYAISCKKWPIPTCSTLHCITLLNCGKTLMYGGGANTYFGKDNTHVLW